MFKTHLQELCQRRHLPLPQYFSTREGPDHDPRFRATVAVAGARFHSPGSSMSNKEAHNKAAQVAVEHLSAVPPLSSSSSSSSSASSTLVAPAAQECKGQLKICSQERSNDLLICSPLPKDSCNSSLSVMSTGVGGQKIEISKLGNAVAEKQQDDFVLYKNLLQELAQKDGLSLPKYSTTRTGPPHIPIFSSFVEIEGQLFEGGSAKTKKQAEMNAAKAAWNYLKQSGCTNTTTPLIYSASHGNNVYMPTQKLDAGGSFDPCSAGVTNGHMAMKQELDPVQQPYGETEKNKVDIMDDKISEDGSSSLSEIVCSNNNVATENAEDPKLEGTSSLSCNGVREYPHKPDFVFPKAGVSTTMKQVLDPVQEPYGATEPKKGDTKEDKISEDDGSLSSSESVWSSNDVATDNAENPKLEETCSLLCNRVRVYPRKPDFVFPKGVNVLPFRDDMWVAVSLDFPNDEGGFV